MPSLTLNVKLAKLSPDSSAGGVYLRLPPSMSALVTEAPAFTAVPLRVRAPLPEAGSVTMVTLSRLWPSCVSTSENWKSDAVKM